MENEEFYNAFMNDALRHPFVLRAFIFAIVKKQYEKTAFYISLKSKRNIKIVIVIIVKHNQYRGNAVSWVIYFGHFKILYSLLNCIVKEKEIIDDWFQAFYKNVHYLWNKIVCFCLDVVRIKTRI